MAVSGLFVTPGTLTNLDPSSEIGNGLSVTKDGIIALKSGVLVENDGLWDISDHSPGVNTLQIGDDIIGEVHNLQPKVAIIRIISVEKEGMQEKSLSAQQLFADITVTELCDRFMPSAGDAMRRRDIIRARVTSTEPMVRATTKEDASLGVLHALCTACGAPLLADDAVPDFNVSCSRCDYTGYRVLSSDFNNLNGLEPSLLNREGTRWSKEAENMLGHDGARPYLSPVADHRRGWSHEIPKEALRSRSSQGRDRPRRDMHEAKCTLCGTDTKVPFKPTAGKPIRCSSCLDLVKQGEADEDKLAAERKLLISMRKESEANAPLRLFVGRLSREVNEDLLRETFSEHGEVVDFHMPIDRETGNPRGFAFVTISPKSAGEAAIKALNGSELEGRKIVVEASQRDSNKGRRNRR
ncbi:MAG: CxxC-x17-CxxC domain-containing protein [Candidatus Thermoplasmatota archaeon]|nr:CxxC-x17-CxxC domain-containing protein [Candidatus Thermoplasmatota archaeon]